MLFQRNARTWLRCLVCWLAAVTFFGGCRRLPEPALRELAEAKDLTAALRLQFGKEVSASDRAVMADTDEASVRFAEEAERATRAVDGTVIELARRLQDLGYRRERQLLDEFSQRFAEYRRVDRETLDLAVENTNLKAQRLSFGPVREASDAFRSALDSMVAATPEKARCQVQQLVSRAEVSLLQIQVLQGPHIAEPDDAAMARLEQTMTGLEGTAVAAMDALTRMATSATTAAVAAANEALGRFKRLSAQLVALSRINSNVRSLSLALGQKPRLTAACDGSLKALEEALAEEGSKASR